MNELAQKIREWQEHNEIKDKANDHTRCPRCNEQLYFCDCHAVMADEILLNHADWILKKAEEE